MTSFWKKLTEIKSDSETRISRLINLVIKIYEGYSFENSIYNRLINSIKVFIVATRKFMIDDCLTKASAIAYTAIVSLIPALAVGLTFLSIFSSENKKEELFRKISLFMTEHSITNVDFVLEAISGLIDNAAKIGIIGTVVMIFTATATLRSLEKSLNDIWKVKQARSLFQKIIYYWAALTLGPVMLIAGMTVATMLSNTFSSAHYNSATVYDDKIWLAGSKGTIATTSMKKIHVTKYDDSSFDYENQRIYAHISRDNVFLEEESRLDPLTFSKANYSDIQFIDNEGWLIADKGVILRTKDRGKSWSISKWGEFTLNDILMLDRNRGFIAANNGVILATETGGREWRVINTDDASIDFKSISSFGSTILISGTKGKIMITKDAGINWNPVVINEAKRKKKLVNLNSSFIIDEREIWITGNDGVLLHSLDGGSTWIQQKFKDYNYYAVFFVSRSEGFIAGEDGLIIQTKDAGASWKSETLPAFKVNRIFSASGLLWAIGNGGTIQYSGNNGNSWGGVSGKSFFAVIINFLAPFLFIWLLFLMAYSTLPNTKVPFKYSAIGAAFTGAIWVIFILLFIVYIKAFAQGTFAIYGTLASIPLFLLMIYTSALIVLYGAEVSFTLMHPETYVNLKDYFEEDKKANMFYGLTILQQIYFRFESGDGATHYSDFLKKAGYNSTDIDFFIKLFAEKQLIMNDTAGNFIPTNSSANIKLTELFDLINEAQIVIPGTYRKGVMKNSIRELFDRLKTSRNKVLADMTLKDLII
ncbi:MAG TPA: YhjD/YihY/BrkB family envelope integrity protein [Spirochaetota bacterium]|nr:YhjD/YihY/BrkB family envelope integrity protein [Spirochaetota bacterium]